MTAALFKAARARLASEFLIDENAEKYLEQHSAAADAAVREILEKSGMSSRIAVVAVGGYGRRQLFPFSDLDILFLLPDDIRQSELTGVEIALGFLWELGLVVGHSVRSLQDCLNQASEDITAQTAMLESRFLWGNRELYQRYAEALHKHLNPLKFFRAKFIEQQQRHLKYSESPYSLEPHIKESAGGLRDLNILVWLIKASGIGSNWIEAAERGLLTRHEADLLTMATQALYRLRVHLHLLNNRHEDRLLFETQFALAKKLKISETAGRRPSELLMQRYYLNAKSIVQLNTIILQALKEWFLPEKDVVFTPCGEYFQTSGDTLDIIDDEVFIRHPDAILKSFLFSQDHPHITKKTTRLYRALLASHSLINDEFRADPVNKATFLKIIQHKDYVYHTLKAMNKWGILGRCIPAFKKIVGQMQHDLFHAYTVDQHTILAIRYMRHFTKSENAHEMPLCTELMLTLKDNWRLIPALLFHDIGKGRGGNHSLIGAEEFRSFAQKFALKKEDADYIEFLVREHLTMSQVAQKQDISDPHVIEQFAKTVGSLDRLMGLYLLTVCDIRATSPTVWNSWKARLLEDLFYSTSKVLRGTSISRDMLVERRRRDALARSKFTDSQKAEINAFWDQLDVAYFMRHSVKDILWHARCIINDLKNRETLSAIRSIAKMPHNYEIMVLTPDKPELFARIVSCFQSFNLSILEARIHTGSDGWVLDSFIITEDGSHPDIKEYFEEVKTVLKRKIDNGEPLDPPVKGRLSRRSKTFPITPEVSLRPDANGRQYLLNVIAADRLGLLSSISRVFVANEVNLVTARIATLGERAEDVFLIEGKVLKDPVKSARFERALLEALEP